MLLSSKAQTGMNVADKLSAQLVEDADASAVIRDLRLQRTTLSKIGEVLRTKRFVEEEVSDGVLVSAISSAARKLIGSRMAKTIADETRHVVTSEDIGDAWKKGQAAATAAAAKLNGHAWEFEDDRHLCEVVASCTNGHGTPWQEVAWIMEHQYGVRANAKGCQVRYWKVSRTENEEAA